ncbi:TetR/AcrR family transcriptional regulator [Oleomonas cavernae]|uniref:TetR/AcrR family transcriptional regulator n=1 Tax=Oleomonas cavernae TaxID=2320859 RepID=A0A418WIH5_9PROT|nr:TetR/AcrR family transcriptional regulator [Oleomonas cavernae]RJF89742.1 TetR/AcrR family transcriptional regulator [Oleomonas cavernae]
MSRPVFDDIQAKLRSLTRGTRALPPQSRAEKSAALRARIIDAAKEEFAAKGYDGASVRAIAAAAGIEQGHLGYHFKTKRALWEATVDVVFADFPSSVAGMPLPRTYEDARAVMRLALHSYADYCTVCPEHARMVFNEATSGGERLEWLVERHIRSRVATLEPVFNAARDRGAVPATSFEAFLLSFLAAIAFTYGLRAFPAAVFGPAKTPVEEVPPVPIEELIALFLR